MHSPKAAKRLAIGWLAIAALAGGALAASPQVWVRVCDVALITFSASFSGSRMTTAHMGQDLREAQRSNFHLMEMLRTFGVAPMDSSQGGGARAVMSVDDDGTRHITVSPVTPEELAEWRAELADDDEDEPPAI